MKSTIIINLLFLSLAYFISSCGQVQQQTEKTSNDNTISTQELKIIEPKIGFTPDISDDAKSNLKRLKVLYSKIDSIVNIYPNYETAKQHLTKKQIEIWENEEDYSKEDHLDVSTWGCSWYCSGGPDSIFASSTLSPYKSLDYKADNIHDFSLRTGTMLICKHCLHFLVKFVAVGRAYGDHLLDVHLV